MNIDCDSNWLLPAPTHQCHLPLSRNHSSWKQTEREYSGVWLAGGLLGTRHSPHTLGRTRLHKVLARDRCRCPKGDGNSATQLTTLPLFELTNGQIREPSNEEGFEGGFFWLGSSWHERAKVFLSVISDQISLSLSLPSKASREDWRKFFAHPDFVAGLEDAERRV